MVEIIINYLPTYPMYIFYISSRYRRQYIIWEKQNLNRFKLKCLSNLLQVSLPTLVFSPHHTHTQFNSHIGKQNMNIFYIYVC